MRLALAWILTGLLTCTATAANGPKTDVIQAGPWRIPIAGEFTSERDERGLHLTGRDGHRISVLFLTSERPSERGEGARRRVETAASLEREWLRVAGEVSDVIRQGPVVRQLTAGRTLVSMRAERSGRAGFVLRYSLFDAVNRVDIRIEGAGSVDGAAARYDPLIEATRSVGPTQFR